MVTFRWMAVRLLSLLALGVSGYLFALSLTGASVPGCSWSDAVDCDSALASAWGKWLGLSVALGGLVCYALILAGSLFAGQKNPRVDALGWRLLEFATPLALGAAVWFIAVQAVALDAWCPYCLVVHACGLIAAVLVLTLRRSASGAAPTRLQPFGAPNMAPRATAPLPPPAIGVPTMLGVLSVAALVLGQVFFPTNLVQTVSAAAIQGEFNLTATDEASSVEPAVLEPTETGAEEIAIESAPSGRPAKRAPGQRMFTLLDGKIKIDVYTHPLLGNPDAEHVILEFFDYGCPHCRQLHELMTKARKRYGDQVAVVTFPWPLEARCNKLVYRTKPKSRGSCRIAELALATFQANADAFPLLHDFIMTGENLPQYTAVLLKAQELVGQNELDKALRSQKPAGKLQQYVDLLAALSQGRKLGLPTQIVGDTLFSGPLETVDDVAKIWEENLGIKPIAE
jgi:uncharacterized membrane protein